MDKSGNHKTFSPAFDAVLIFVFSLLILLISPPARAGFTNTWSSAIDKTYDVALGDYDNDGDLDLLVVNNSAGSRVYRNDGGGVFTSVWTSAVSSGMDTAWADYDRDGDLDFAISNNGATNRVYRNDGGGVFTLVWQSTEPVAQSQGLAWGDCDGDGDPDLLIGNNAAVKRIYRNDGGGVFTLLWSSADTDNTRAVAWTDYDGDGRLDFLAANYGISRVYHNDGSGNFSVGWSAGLSDTSLDGSWGDCNGDGKPDFALANISAKPSRVYRSNGDGTFSLSWSSPVSTDFSDTVSWGDYDADGDLDLLLGNYSAQANKIYANDGNCNFSLAFTSPDLGQTYGTAWGDYDNDGDLDYVAGNYNAISKLYRNDNNPVNAAPSVPAAIHQVDGNPGVVTLQWNSSTDDHTPASLIGYQIKIGTCSGCNNIVSGAAAGYPGNAGASTLFRITLPVGTYYWSVRAIDSSSFALSNWSAEDSFHITTDPYNSQWTSAESDPTSSIALGDYDNDGDLDQLVGNNGASCRVYRNDAGVFSLVWTAPQSDPTSSVAWGDYDNDGRLDLLIGNNGAASRIYRNTGGGSFSLAWTAPQTDPTSGVAWIDYNGDGRIDLLLGNNGAASKIYRNDSGGAFSLAWTAPQSDPTSSVGWADYNADGRPDLLLGGNGAPIRVYRNDGAGAFSLAWSSPQTDPVYAIAWGDYDADGRPDILTGAYNAPKRIYRNTGASFSLVWSSAETDKTRAIVWGDFDGDGNLDVFAANENQPLRLYQNAGGGSFTLAWSSLESSDSRGIAAGDTDGDLDLDFVSAVYNAPNHQYRNKLNPVNARPAAPALTHTANGTPGVFTLSWSAPADDHTPAALLGYQLRIGTTSGANDVFSGALANYPGNPGHTTSFSIDLPAGAYYWSVAAIDTSGFVKSNWSAEDVFSAIVPDLTPPVFSGVAGVKGCGSGCLELNWTAATDAQGSLPITYSIFKSTTSGGENFAAPDTTTTSTSFQINGLANDTPYYFVVRAKDAANNEESNTKEIAGVPVLLPSLTKYPSNPVMQGDGAGFDSAGVMSPNVTYDGTLFRMWYDGRTNNNDSNIGYAVSLDGVNWARVTGFATAGAVFELNADPTAFDSKAAYSAHVMPDPPTAGDKFYSWYIGVRADNPYSGRIGLARSNDGITWSRVTGPGTGGAAFDWTHDTFDDYAAYAPSVIYENGMYKMWYSGTAVDPVLLIYNYRIGYATSTDGVSWNKFTGDSSHGSVMDQGAGAQFDSQRATHPNVYKQNGVYKMFYSGYDGAHYRIGYAASPDGLHWTKHPGAGTGGSIIDNGVQYDTGIAARSSLLIVNGHISLWFDGYTGTGNNYVIMYANDSGVMPPKLNSIAITPSAAQFLQPGQSLNFTAMCTYAAVNPYCGATTCACTNAVAWASSNPAAATVAQLGGAATAVAPGSTSVTANCAGITSNTVALTVDNTPPSNLTFVNDGLGADIDMQGADSQLSANWSASSDAESGVAYYVAAGTTPGATNTFDWMSAGASTSFTKTGLALANGATYYWSVKAKNGAGLSSAIITSDGVTVNNTKPAPISFVNDGLGVDLDFTGTRRSLSGNWATSSDPVSGITAYYYAVGTTPGATNTIAWTNVATATFAMKTGLNLTNGVKYYWSVKSENGLGVFSDVATSDGITVDLTPPATIAFVNDGLGADEDSTGSNTELSANWGESSDAESGISAYYFAIGSAPDTSDIVGWTNLGIATSTTRTGLSLTNGATYYYSVKAMNGLGVFSVVTVSDGIAVNITPPSGISFVYDGPGADEDFTTSATQLTANWATSSDPVNGIAAYYYSAGTSPGASNTIPWTNSGLTTNVTRNGLSLTNGATYYWSVKALNGLGVFGGVTSSDGIKVDTTPPADISFVNDGRMADEDITSNTTFLAANWAASTDNESGVTAYYFAIGTTPGGNDVSDWASAGTATLLVKSGLSLNQGVTYYWSVKAMNGAGLYSAVKTSDGIKVDTTPPGAIAFVNDGAGADEDVQGAATQLTANWAASTDAESGIAAYYIAAGTTPGGTNIISWTSAGNATGTTKTGLSLTNGATYYWSVKALNGAGLFGAVTTSDGIKIVSTPPATIAFINDGNSDDIDLQTSTTSLSANWGASSDPIYGITAYYYAAGTTAGGTNVTNWTSAGALTNATVTGLTLTEGASYYWSVKAVNGLGVFSAVSTSDGVRVDSVGPVTIITYPVENQQVAGSVIVKGTVTDATLTEWHLYYGPSASPNSWKEISNGHSQVLNSALGTWDTSKLHGAYTLRLVATDASGRTSTATVKVEVTNNKNITGTIPSGKWLLISAPVQPDNTTPTTMFGTGEYKIYQWNPQATDDPVLQKYRYPSTLNAGSAFWIKSFGGDMSYSYNGLIADTTLDYTVSLKSGWNMIGSPFDRDFPLAQAQVKYRGSTYSIADAAAQGILSSAIYEYDTSAGSWVQKGLDINLTSGTGYELRAYVNADLILNPGAGLPGGLARRVRPVEDYRVNISASAPNSADVDNYVVASSAASEEFDALDTEEPPLAPDGKYISLFFDRNSWGAYSGRYCGDSRPLAKNPGDSESWSFTTETNENGQTVTLTWNPSALPIDRFSFTLVNLDTSERIDMATRNSYSFVAAGGDIARNHFKIEIVKLQVQQVTKTYALSPGWNLISVPLEPEITGALAQLGDDLPIVNVYQFYDGAFYPAEKADIQTGLGYWVYASNNTQIDIVGEPTPAGKTVDTPLKPGWNAIGNPFDAPLAWGDNIMLTCGGATSTLSQAEASGIITGLYVYENDTYSPLPSGASLEPWRGYFIKSTADCTLTIAQ